MEKITVKNFCVYMKAYGPGVAGWAGTKLHSFLVSLLHRGEWVTSSSGKSAPVRPE